jgi:hypothetical protein
MSCSQNLSSRTRRSRYGSSQAQQSLSASHGNIIICRADGRDPGGGVQLPKCRDQLIGCGLQSNLLDRRAAVLGHPLKKHSHQLQLRITKLQHHRSPRHGYISHRSLVIAHVPQPTSNAVVRKPFQNIPALMPQ